MRALREQMTDRGALPSVYVRMPRMSAIKLVLWGLLVILDAVALAFVTGLVNPQEKVNRLWLVVAAAAGLSCAMKSWMSCSHRSACSAQVSSAVAVGPPLPSVVSVSMGRGTTTAATGSGSAGGNLRRPVSRDALHHGK